MSPENLSRLVESLSEAGRILAQLPGHDSRLAYRDESGATIVHDAPLDNPANWEQWERFKQAVRCAQVLLARDRGASLVNPLAQFGIPEAATRIRELESLLAWGLSGQDPDKTTEAEMMQRGGMFQWYAETIRGAANWRPGDDDAAKMSLAELPPGGDPTAYRLASEFLEPAGAFDTLHKLDRALKNNTWIRWFKPTPQRRMIHAGDWMKLKKLTAAKDPLDATADVIDAVLDAEKRRQEIRSKQ